MGITETCACKQLELRSYKQLNLKSFIDGNLILGSSLVDIVVDSVNLTPYFTKLALPDIYTEEFVNKI